MRSIRYGRLRLGMIPILYSPLQMNMKKARYVYNVYTVCVLR